MTITVKAPNGATIQFPAGTDTGTITRVMSENFGGTEQKGLLQSAGETLADATTSLAPGMMAKFSDEIFAAGMTPFEMARGAIRGQDEGKGFGERLSDSYSRALQFNRDYEKRAAERSPIASTAGELVGGTVMGGGLAKQGVTLLNVAKPTIPHMVAAGAAEGAAYGGLYGAGSGENMQERIEQAAKGAGFGALTGGAFGVVGAMGAKRAASKAVPTVDDIRAQADAVYDAADKAGVVLSPYKVDLVAKDIYGTAIGEGFHPSLHPKAMAAFKEIDNLSGQPVSFKTMDQMRRLLKSAASSNEADERRIASIMIEKLDDHLGDLRQTDVIGGNARDAANAIVKARDLWGKMRKGETIENLIERATTRAGQYSQSGMENALRTEFRQLSMNAKKMRGFSKEEQAAIKKVARGGPLENALRLVGKFAPRGVVSGLAALGTGATYGAGAGAALMAAGEIGKRSASAMTKNSARAASELMRGGRPQVQAIPAFRQALIDAALAAEATQIPQRFPPYVNTGQR